jgi:hypothetical protein
MHGVVRQFWSPPQFRPSPCLGVSVDADVLDHYRLAVPLPSSVEGPGGGRSGIFQFVGVTGGQMADGVIPYGH